jgi:hypothetical protein
MPARKLAPLKGHAKPRLAPPTPAVSDIAGYRTTAAKLGIDLMPWQETAARYLEAKGPKGRHLYREVAVIVARQNGKSILLVPLIVKRLLEGRRIMHTAQDRKLPFEVFEQVAELMAAKYASMFPTRNGRVTRPRFANGQEEIRLNNGGIYRIVAPTRGGARGPTNDDVIVDELREMDTWDFIAGAKPTMTVSKDPQMIYLSNAGTAGSIVLNALRGRADSDPVLAYLEWSASPGRPANDPVGWAESNPSIGHEREGMGSTLETLEIEHRTASLEGTMALYETEHLCRWVPSMRERLVGEAEWALCRDDGLEAPRSPAMGVSMSPDGKRATVAIAWMRPDDSVGLRVLLEGSGDPFDTDALGRDVKALVGRLGLRGDRIAYDPLTDLEIAKFLKKPTPISGQKFANASANFVNRVHAGKLRWADADAVTDDLMWTSRKQDNETGTYQAVRAQDDRSITASLAAIRAVGLASGPKPSTPKVM